MKKISRKRVFSKISAFVSTPIVRYLLILLLVTFGIMGIIYFVEAGKNDDISSFSDVLWYTLATITTVGYGDISPSSSLGRIAGSFLLLFGVVIFGGISGKMASVLFDQQLKMDRGLLKLRGISGHFLICGWKPDFEQILDGILAANPDIPPEKIVLINEASQENIEKIKTVSRYRGMKFLFGDYTEEETLLRANIKSAERVLVLSDYSKNFSQMETDSKTVLAVLTIGSLNPKLYIAAEIIDSKFEKHLSLARCDEIILSHDYERSLLVSASSGVGLSHILKELITETSGEGLVIENIPEECIGKTYGEYRKSLSVNRVLIGILENTGNFYYRRKEALSEAQKNPDVKKVIENLKKIKNLRSNRPVLAPSDDYIIPSNSKAIFVCGKRKRSE